MLKRFLFAFFAFIGLIVPAAFALALLAVPPASPAPMRLPGAIATSPMPAQMLR
ncbi:MAG: hypothetical protein WB769_01980 [Pseudolabrys sp.]|jgi:hypothetical protein